MRLGRSEEPEGGEVLGMIGDRSRRGPEARVSTLRINGETLVVLAVDRDAPDVPATLTRAEQDIVHLLVDGASTADIARRRGCSMGTVSKHLGAVYRKMGVGSRDELIATLGDRARRVTD